MRTHAKIKLERPKKEIPSIRINRNHFKSHINVYYFYIVLAVCATALADGSEKPLQCKERITQAGKILMLEGGNINFEISDTIKTCKSHFTYRKPLTQKEMYITKSLPNLDELGNNSQNDIFVATSPENKATYIGSIPVIAELVGPDTYRNIEQVGGSLYETIYLLGKNQIKIKELSAELIFSDTQCVFSPTNGNKCHDVTGTIDSPVCVQNINGRKTLTQLEECSSLLKIIKLWIFPIKKSSSLPYQTERTWDGQ